MNKEYFMQQIESAKQQIISERRIANDKISEQKRLAEQEKIRNEEKIKTEEERIKEETKRNFAGTNIIEFLEEIRDSELLISSQKTVQYTEKRFFWREAKYNVQKNIPMKIDYRLDSVSASFNYYHIDGKNGSPCFDDYSSMTITKKDNRFQFTCRFPGNQFQIASSDPKSIIGGIAKVVAIQQIK